MALSRLVWALGQQSWVRVLSRCGLPLPGYFLADEKHSHCLTEKGYWPTIVDGRVLWHLGDTEAARAAAFLQSDGELQQVAVPQQPAYRVRGVLRDGFDSTVKSMRTLCPEARLGTACATRSFNSRRHSWPSRPRCARRYARSCILCCTGCVRGRAYG